MHLPNLDFGKDWIILLENPAKAEHKLLLYLKLLEM